MFSELLFTFVMLLFLGIFHGINPGMGWLFAVSLGLQEQRRAAVWSALLPLALGHALAIGLTLVLVGMVGLMIPVSILKWIVAVILISFGIYKLIRNRHPRYGGMQVNFRQLTTWSFLMASAHGAGLMVLPFLFKGMGADPSMSSAQTHMHSHNTATLVDHASILSSLPAEPLMGVFIIVLHTLGYLLVMGLIAVIVYEKLGLRLLKSAWFNIDLIWAGALILSGILIPVI